MIHPKKRKSEQKKIRRWASNNKEKVYDELGRKCNKCGTCEDLTIHHKEYVKGMGYLEILCNKCHRDFHNKEFKKRLLMECLKEVNKFNSSAYLEDFRIHLENKINSIPVKIIPNLKIDGFEK